MTVILSEVGGHVKFVVPPGGHAFVSETTDSATAFVTINFTTVAVKRKRESGMSRANTTVSLQ